MARSDFDMLTDDEILNAIDVAAMKLKSKLWPKVIAQAPDLKDKEDEFFERCKLELIQKHGLEELLKKEGVWHGGVPS